jgi:uncharacterized protein (DUF2062 family)
VNWSYWIPWIILAVLCGLGSAILSSFLVAYWVRWFERRETERLHRELNEPFVPEQPTGEDH